MSENTKRLTWGAMITAIFGALLLINMQTGRMLEGIFLYIFPIPMVAFSVRYGFKSSLPVLISMTLIAFLCGSISGIFYAVFGAVIGMTLGTCLNRKMDPRFTLLLTMLVCIIAAMLETVLIAFLMGQSLQTYIERMQTEMTESMNLVMNQLAASGTANADQLQLAMEQIMTDDMILRMYLLATAFSGALQGYLTYWLSLVILRKLKYPVEKPQKIYQFVPPKWTGLAALLLVFGYFYSSMGVIQISWLKDLLQTLGLVGYFYLLLYGMLGTTLFLRRRVHMGKAFAILLSVLLFFVFPMGILVVGYLYLCTTLRDRILETASSETEPNRSLPGSQSGTAYTKPGHRMPHYINPADDEDENEGDS